MPCLGFISRAVLIFLILFNKHRLRGDSLQITVKLFATLREGREKIQTFDLPMGTTPENILEKLGIRIDDVAILLINGIDGEFSRILANNDLLSIFPPVGGG